MSQLTSRGGFSSFMLVSSTRDQSGARRLIGAILLAFLVFLPLHYHVFSPSSQLAKECSCVHGTRTQLALDVDPPAITPAFTATLFAAQYDFSWAGEWSRLLNVRGPPIPLSI